MEFVFVYFGVTDNISSLIFIEDFPVALPRASRAAPFREAVPRPLPHDSTRPVPRFICNMPLNHVILSTQPSLQKNGKWSCQCKCKCERRVGRKCNSVTSFSESMITFMAIPGIHSLEHRGRRYSMHVSNRVKII
jgi:hypothetical protein